MHVKEVPGHCRKCWTTFGCSTPAASELAWHSAATERTFCTFCTFRTHLLDRVIAAVAGEPRHRERCWTAVKATKKSALLAWHFLSSCAMYCRRQ